MQRPTRTLILAFDGTSNEFDDTNTNIVRLCSLLEVQDRDRQMIYYQPGIGTYTPPGITGSIKQTLAKTADLLVAWYLSEHVMGGYEFLMNNHLPGDKICIFGFSRGAYTARALAGMLHCVGLLPQGNHEQVPFAYRLFSKGSELGLKFKETFCKTVEIEFLGVWDTVASVGLLMPKTLPFVSNDTIKTFRHAVSLDEHRKRFDVTLWSPDEEATGPKNPSYANGQDASVMEVWFAGYHADVGGGQVKDGTNPNLANISFRWMLNQIKMNSSVVFDDDMLDRNGIPVDCVPRSRHAKARPFHSKRFFPRFGSEETWHDEAEPFINHTRSPSNLPTWDEADEMDCAADDHDALKLQPLWWLTQLIVWRGKTIDEWGNRVYPHDRRSMKHNQVHYSVWRRIEKRPGYSPRTRDLPSNWVATSHRNQPSES